MSGELPTGRRPRDALPSATGVSQMRTPCEPDPCELPGVQASMEVVQRGLSREGPRGGRCTGRGRRARHPAAWLTVMEIHYLHRSELLSMAVMLGQRTRRTHAGSRRMEAHRASEDRCLARRRQHDVLFLPRRSLMRKHRHRWVHGGVSSALDGGLSLDV